ncbi:MAG: ATP-binding protein [Fimbriimonas sp.]
MSRPLMKNAALEGMDTAALAPALLDALSDDFVCVDADWRITYLNLAAQKHLERPREDLLGRVLWEVWPAGAETIFETNLRLAMGAGIATRFEAECVVHSVYYDVRSFPLHGGLAIHMRDATERRQAEEDFRRSQERLAAMLQNLPGGAVLLDGEKITLNRAVEEILGFSNQEVNTLSEWFLLTRGGDEAAALSAKAEYEAIKKRGFQKGVTRELLAKDGSPRIVDIAAFVDEVGEVWLIHDLTERLATEEKFRILFQQSSEAHVLIDETGIIDANRATVEMLGCASAADIIGKQPSEFSPEYQPDGRLTAEKSLEMDWLAKQRGSHRFEWMHQAVDGRLLPCEVTITELTISGKSAQLVAWRDLSQHKETEARLRRNADELRRMADELQVANERLIDARDAALESARAKSRFLATVSHEIRTPLNGVMGMTGLLMRTELNPEQQEFVRTIHSSGETLLRVIGDVLDLSKAEAGKLTLEIAEFDLTQTVRETTSLFMGQAMERGLKLHTFGLEAPLRVKADAVRVKQILGNLIMNAIKFTPAGEVRITLDSQLDREDYLVTLSVKDTGIGIPASRLDAIFESFSQADNSTHRLFGGTGLGLTITKRLVEMMGGKIKVESELYSGSEFHVSLRLPVASDAVVCPHAINAERADITGLRVLLVEDNAVNIMVARRNLEMLGCDVVVATSGEASIQAVKSAEFDIVLMDVQMPGTDGLAATRAIHQLRADLPVIALTANAMDDDRRACREAGMIGFLTKPFNQAQLIESLSMSLKSS